MTHQVDFVVVGAGIAGASAAASLARRGSVVVLEAEAHAGYHTTGRSAALYSTLYGNETIRCLTRASRSFLFDPPHGFAPSPLVSPRPTLYFATAEQLGSLERFVAEPDVARTAALLDADEVQRLLPVFAPRHVAGAAYDAASADIDVDALHQGFLRQARKHGAQVLFDHPVIGLRADAGMWQVKTHGASWTARIVIDAAGAWADRVAEMAGLAPMGLQPLRRTALLIDSPDGMRCDAWPAAIDIDERFYFKPEAGMLLLSPADEHPSAPCDAQPDEFDVAVAVDHFERATGHAVPKIGKKWAGLRVFSRDRSPIVGFDPRASGFFWLAGQGGYGIQTAPAMGALAAALACHEAPPSHILQAGVEPALLSPRRFLPPDQQATR